MFLRFVFLLVSLIPTLVIAMPSSAAQEATPVSSSASPSAVGVSATVLCSVTFPAEFLPAGPAVVVFWRDSFEPGYVEEYPAGTIPDSIAATCVVEGTFSTSAEGDAVFVAGGVGREETISPGTEVQVGKGDAIVYLANEAAQTIANTGDSSVVAVSAGIFSIAPPPCVANASCPTPAAGFETEFFLFIDEARWGESGLVGGDVDVLVRRIELDPGAIVTSGETYPTLRFVETGAVEWNVLLPGAATPVLTPLKFGPMQGIHWQPLRPGSTLILRNGGDEPVVFYELVLAPPSDGPATPIAGTPASATPGP
jgi:hypothetical protein